MSGSVVRRAIAGSACALAVLSALWAAGLIIFGGADLTIFGRAVTSHEPLRPLMILGVALAVYMLAGGDTRITRWARVVSGRSYPPSPLQQRIAALSRTGQLDRVAIALLAIVTLIAGVRLGSKTAAGSDSYGYLSEAELFLQGNLKVAQPWVREMPWPLPMWTFSPLGFKPAPKPGHFSVAGYRPSYDPATIVPTYSPGLPLLMAGAKRLAGNSAMFWILPLSSVAFVLATYGIGCRFGSQRFGTMAAFLVATSPPVLTYGLLTMTDVPVAAAWTVTIWCLLGESIAAAFAGGIALGLAVLIRPNLVPLLAVIGLWVSWRVLRGAPHRLRHLTRAVILLGGAAVGIAATAAVFWMTYGSPLESGYGPASGYFALRYILPNLRNYTHWLSESQTPIVALGFVALAMPASALWPRANRADVIMCALFVAANCAEFIPYLVGDNRGYLRFLLPSYPFLMLGVSAVGLWCTRLAWRGAAPLVGAATIALGLGGIDFASRIGAFDLWHDVAAIESGVLVHRMTPENSVVLSMQQSGSIRYYGGRMTMRWDTLDAVWLDRAVAWLAERGVSVFVLVDRAERDEMKAHFRGQALAARLDEPPVFQFGDTVFYDFTRPPGSIDATEVIPMKLQRGKSLPPAPPPTLVLKRP